MVFFDVSLPLQGVRERGGRGGGEGAEVCVVEIMSHGTEETTPPVIHHPSHVTRHTPHVTRHTCSTVVRACSILAKRSSPRRRRVPPSRESSDCPPSPPSPPCELKMRLGEEGAPSSLTALPGWFTALPEVARVSMADGDRALELEEVETGRQADKQTHAHARARTCVQP